MSRREDRVLELYTALSSSFHGLTQPQMADILDCSIETVRIAIHDLRALLGDTDSVNLVANPVIWGLPWRYELVGNLDDARPWAANRIKDGETRVRTLASVFASLVKATKGNTREGKRVRMMEVAMRHLVENLDTLGNDL